MKRTSLKVHRNFKLLPKINLGLKRESKRTGLTETKIVEVALAGYLAVKR